MSDNTFLYTQASKKLFAAIIHRAVMDTCMSAAVKRKGRKAKNLITGEDAEEENDVSKTVQEAFEFLFDDKCPHAVIYLSFLDIEIAYFRDRLLKTMYASSKQPAAVLRPNPITSSQKRRFLFNYNNYLKELERKEFDRQRKELDKQRKEWRT